jgi:WD40 repeat protein
LIKERLIEVSPANMELEVDSHFKYVLKHQTTHLNPENPKEQGIYILDIALPFKTTSWCLDSFATISSANDINIYHLERFHVVQRLRGHSDRISQIRYSKIDVNLLWSCSIDGTLRLWDLRSQHTAQIYESLSSSERYTTLDTTMNDHLIMTGTELCDDTMEEPSGKIKLWDIRSTQPVAELRDAHTDDVTQVIFHPTSPHYFMSGALDQLVCYCYVDDMMNEEQDFGIMTVMNIEQPVAKLGFCGNDYRQIYALSYAETFSVWDYQEAQKSLDLGDVR